MGRICVQHSLQEPNMDQHRPNIGSIYAGGTQPLRRHGHVQHGNGGSHNKTRCASKMCQKNCCPEQPICLPPYQSISHSIHWSMSPSRIKRASCHPLVAKERWRDDLLSADKASMTCSHLAIYLATYLSSLPSSHPCINLTFTHSLSLSLALSLSLVWKIPKSRLMLSTYSSSRLMSKWSRLLVILLPKNEDVLPGDASPVARSNIFSWILLKMLLISSVSPTKSRPST